MYRKRIANLKYRKHIVNVICIASKSQIANIAGLAIRYNFKGSHSHCNTCTAIQICLQPEYTQSSQETRNKHVLTDDG